MKITVANPVGRLQKGDSIIIKPNTANYWVGLNGSGKTITMSGLAFHVNQMLKQKSNWNTAPLPKFKDCFTYEGFETVSGVTLYTAKMRQSQWLAIDTAFESAAGLASIWQSEGQNAQSELSAGIKYKDEPNHLYLFDEIDGTLDARAKRIFFEGVCRNVKGTVVVCTHDVYYPVGQEVFDFETRKQTRFLEYFDRVTDFTKKNEPEKQQDSPKPLRSGSRKKKSGVA